jgi:predicted SAM-dependent methyltransferase
LHFFEKNILELKLLWVQNWRIFRSLDKGFVEFAYTLKLILLSKNSLILTKILIPILVAILLCLKLIKKTLKLFYNLIMKLKASINKVFNRFRFFLYNYLIRGDNFYCLFCGANFRTTLPTGLDNPIANTLVGGGRRKVLCPRCKSNDRERLIYYYLKTETNFLKSNKQYNVLHIAPENNLRKIFSQKQNFNYYPGDLRPKNRDFKLDITNLSQFKNNYFDLIVCSHVLEHVPNDKQAMKELYRVLKPNGVAILQVPISRILKKTYEDFSIVTPKERLKAFGQRDHVRIYGQDYVQRLKVAGFDVEEYKISETLSRELIKKYCLNFEEVLFVGRKNESS